MVRLLKSSRRSPGCMRTWQTLSALLVHLGCAKLELLMSCSW